MRLVINGEEKDLAGITTLLSLVEQLGFKPDRLAVELNHDIVPRTNWADTFVKDGDKLEMVHFVGGGFGLDG